MLSDNIILAGEGHGCVAVYLGIKDYFRSVHILTKQKDDFYPIRSSDKFIESPFHSDSNVFLSAGYRPLIKDDLIQLKKCLNIHYACLPRYRGMHPIVWGILDDEKFLGWTLHEIDIGMDSGKIVYQYKVENDRVKTAWNYMLEFDQELQNNIGKILIDYLNNKIEAKEQDHQKAIWGFKRNLKDCEISFSMTHDQIKRFFRALSPPYPYPFIMHKEQKLQITKYDLFYAPSEMLTLGRVANIDQNGIYIRTKDGYLIIKEALDDNNKLLDLRSLFRIGSRL